MLDLTILCVRHGGIIGLGVHLNATAHVCRATQDFTTSRVNISPPNGTEDGSNVTLLLPVQNVTADSGSRAWSHFFGVAGHWMTSVITPRSSVRIPCCTCG